MKHRAVHLDIDQLLIGIVSAIATVAPFLMLAPTAYLVAWRTVQHLAWPLWVAVIAAVGLEALGLVIAVTGLDAWTWNRSKRAKDPSAPVALPVALLAVYFVSAEALTFGLDIASGPVTFAKLTQAVFPVLGLAGMVTLAIRYDHEQRRREVADGKAEAKAERARKRVQKLPETGQVLPEVSTPVTEPLPEWRPTSWQAFMAAHPDMADMTGKRIAELAGVSDRTGRNWKAAATALVNGNGHERIAVKEAIDAR